MSNRPDEFCLLHILAQKKPKPHYPNQPPPASGRGNCYTLAGKMTKGNTLCCRHTPSQGVCSGGEAGLEQPLVPPSPLQDLSTLQCKIPGFLAFMSFPFTGFNFLQLNLDKNRHLTVPSSSARGVCAVSAVTNTNKTPIKQPAHRENCPCSSRSLFHFLMPARQQEGMSVMSHVLLLQITSA